MRVTIDGREIGRVETLDDLPITPPEESRYYVGEERREYVWVRGSWVQVLENPQLPLPGLRVDIVPWTEEHARMDRAAALERMRRNMAQMAAACDALGKAFAALRLEMAFMEKEEL